MSGTSKAVALHRSTLRKVRDMPRVDLNNVYRILDKNPEWQQDGTPRIKWKASKYKGFGHGGAKNLPVLGWEASKPFWQAAPNEIYNKDYFKRREYPPFSLHKLQVGENARRLRQLLLARHRQLRA